MKYIVVWNGMDLVFLSIFGIIIAGCLVVIFYHWIVMVLTNWWNKIFKKDDKDNKNRS